MTEELHGHVTDITREIDGDEIVAAAPAGATTLFLRDVADFAETGGQVLVDGNLYPYASIDDDTASITLTAGLSSSVAAGELVEVWETQPDGDMAAVVRYTAMVVDDSTGDLVPADIDHALVGTLPVGVRGLVGESVVCVRDGGTWVLTRVLGKTGSIVTDGSVHGADIYSDGQTGTGTADAQLTAQGRLVRSSSSQRVKTDIEPMTSAQWSTLLDVIPVTYRRIGEDDGPTYPGFIAEQAAEVDADLWVTWDVDGDPDGIRYAEMVSGLVGLARDQRDQLADQAHLIADLTARIDALEADRG